MVEGYAADDTVALSTSPQAATSLGPWISVPVDPMSGDLMRELWVSLVYIPGPKPGATSLPTCLKPLPPETVIGRIECEEPVGSAPKALLADHVRQHCREEAQGSSQKSWSPSSVQLAGCQRAKASLDTFEPRLRLELGP